jgi:parallel beta-helix repeat protein
MVVKRLLLLAFVFSVMVTSAPVLADADFYVVAGGGGVGTKITSLPYNITKSGFYYLAGDLTSTDYGITISVDNVTIDLMGFSLIGPGPTSPKRGIAMSGRKNVEIRNGTLRNWVQGIYEDGAQAANHRVINVRASNNNDFGIYMWGACHYVSGCNASYNIATTTGNHGQGIYIRSGIITGCEACYNSGAGIELDEAGSILGNVVRNNTGFGIYFTGTSAIVVDRNAAATNGTNYSAAGTGTAMGLNANVP